MSKSFLAALFALICAGCGIQIRENGAALPTAPISTATLLPASSPRVRQSETPLAFAAAPSPTLAPVEGITATQLNVRAEPSTASAVLGMIPANTAVQIVGKDPGENWWQILYLEAGQANEGQQGLGWVTAQYVSTAENAQVPVIGGGGSNRENPNAAHAVIQQQLNVRSGPGTSFNSLGTLNPQDVATLTGKDSNGAWLQIEYPAGPEGKGWINAAFAQAQGVENLPIVSDAGQVIGTGTPVDTPLPPTPTVVLAPGDQDSAQAPSANVTFTPNGTHSLQFTSDVSSPTGDRDDWIQFTPFTTSVLLELTCRGNGGVIVEILQDNQLITSWNMSCGERKAIPTGAGTAYQIHIQARASNELTYTQYTLKITSQP